MVAPQVDARILLKPRSVSLHTRSPKNQNQEAFDVRTAALVSWLKIDDGFTDHPKIKKVGPMAGWAHLRGLSYCARFLTDGTIPREVAEDISRSMDLFLEGDKTPTYRTQVIKKLVDAALWEKLPDGSFQIHDYLKYNPSRQHVEAERAATKARVEKHRQRGGKFGGSSTSDPVTVLPTAAPSRPVPVNTITPALPSGAAPLPGATVETRPKDLEAVREYWKTESLNGRPEDFHDHFDSNGWKVSGRAPMRDWKAAARYWSRNQAARSGPRGIARASNYISDPSIADAAARRSVKVSNEE